jgi:endonuclease/exonuclease/phosphatase family metal-dependent hydrolase
VDVLPADAARVGTLPIGAPPRRPGTLRVATWNLWWRFPRDGEPAAPGTPPWQARQEPIRATLAALDADVVCLQEVWAEDHRGADGDGAVVDQAAVLAAALGLRVGAPPTRFWSGIGFRNTVLSRWPVHATAEHTLPGGVRRALAVEIDAPFGPLSVLTTHLSHEPDAGAARCAEAEALLRLAAAHHPGEGGYPVIVGGDLNATPHTDEVRLLTGERPAPVPGFVLHDVWPQAGDGTSGVTWTRAVPYVATATFPERRIDYLFVGWRRPRPWGNPVAAWRFGGPVDTGPAPHGHGPVWPSDHLGVAADLTCPDAPTWVRPDPVDPG